METDKRLVDHKEKDQGPSEPPPKRAKAEEKAEGQQTREIGGVKVICSMKDPVVPRPEGLVLWKGYEEAFAEWRQKHSDAARSEAGLWVCFLCQNHCMHHYGTLELQVLLEGLLNESTMAYDKAVSELEAWVKPSAEPFKNNEALLRCAQAVVDLLNHHREDGYFLGFFCRRHRCTRYFRLKDVFPNRQEHFRLAYCQLGNNFVYECGRAEPPPSPCWFRMWGPKRGL